MTQQMILEAFGAESRRLSEVVAAADDAAFARPSPCFPWTVAELVHHVRMTMGRLTGMLAAPEAAGSHLVPAADYYRADQRFSAATNADRIHSAQCGAATLPGAAARARDFDEARQHAWDLLQAAPPGRVVQTRHGDRMLLTEFLRTRVLELAVHGLDLAAALEYQPWMTAPAAQVTEELLLPSAAAARLRAETGWDQVTLIAKLTGRRSATSAETPLIQSLGIQPLALSLKHRATFSVLHRRSPGRTENGVTAVTASRSLVSAHSRCSGCSSRPAGSSPHSPAAGSSSG